MNISFLPKWLVLLLSKNLEIQIELNILISNLLLIFTFIFWGNYLINLANSIPHFCLFQEITGVNCPFCGITRSLCAISQGKVFYATQLNISGLFIFASFIIQVFLRVISIRNIEKVKVIMKISKSIEFSLLGIIFFNWIKFLFDNFL